MFDTDRTDFDQTDVRRILDFEVSQENLHSLDRSVAGELFVDELDVNLRTCGVEMPDQKQSIPDQLRDSVRNAVAAGELSVEWGC